LSATDSQQDIIVRLSSLLLRAGACLVLAAPSAAAQTRVSTELFIVRNSPLAPESSLYGLGLTFSGGAVGVRGSAAAAFRSTSTDDGESIDVDAWTGEVDLILQPLRLGGLGAPLPLAPYVFGGLGRISQTNFDGFREAWGAASYGAGLGLSLTEALSVTGEARYRVPLSEALDDSDAGFDSSFPRGWEYRFGLSITFGG
jgi:hypothetical protein